jgi:hypothetical protein
MVVGVVRSALRSGSASGTSTVYYFGVVSPQVLLQRCQTGPDKLDLTLRYFSILLDVVLNLFFLNENIFLLYIL